MEIFEEYGIEFLVRYAHIISGVTWIGILYYFNFAQTPAFAAFEAGPRTEAVAKLVPRAMWWFRWAALSTFLFGLLLFVLGIGGDLAPFEEMTSYRTLTILAGMLFGFVMFSNVWGIIWPAQRVAIASAQGVLAGKEADPRAAEMARRAACASRTNTFLSIPMLFFMVAAPHFIEGFATSENPIGPEGGSRVVWYLVVLAIVVVAEAIVFKAPAPGGGLTWHIDKHQNTIIGGTVLTVILYVLVEILFG